MQRARVVLAVAVAALGLAACGNLAPPSVAARHAAATCHTGGQGIYSRPDPHCTPGQWIDRLPRDQAKARAIVCAPGYNPRPAEPVTRKLKYQALALYGLPASQGGYVTESDHKDPLWLGGATTIANLWPEPNYPGLTHATFVANPKDKLEDELYRRVCQARTMTPAAARRVFSANDWVPAYRRYVPNG